MLCVIFAAIRPARAEYFLSHWENQRVDFQRRFLLDSWLGYYRSQSEYNAVGQATQVTTPSGNLESYERIPLDLGFTYGITSRLSLFAHFRILRLSYHLSNGSSAKRIGLGDQSLGFNFSISQPSSHRRAWRLDWQIQVDAPAYDNDSAINKNLPLLGDGSVDLTLGPFITWPLSLSPERQLTLTAGLGYTQRNRDFSSHVPFHLSLKYSRQSTGSLHMDLGLQGFFSLNSDRRDAPSNSRQETQSGGSDFISAINPALSQLRFGLGYSLSQNTILRTHLYLPLTGTSSPKGTSIFLGLQYLWTKEEGPSQTPHPMKSSQGQSAASDERRMSTGKVSSVNDRLFIIKINIGSNHGLEVDDDFEIYKQDQVIARARVTHLKNEEAALKIIQFYQEVPIQTGFVARQVPK